MYANRFTAFVDACSLFGALHRNLLLSLAEVGFFRIRWSAEVMAEIERNLVPHFAKRESNASTTTKSPEERAAASCAAMRRAFEDAEVTDYETIVPCIQKMPDPNDAHVVAAALKIRASVIVTENTKHFPASVIGPLDLETKTADEFIADTMDLNPPLAVSAVSTMRQRFRRPSMTGEQLLRLMEARGLMLTVDSLKDHVAFL